MADGKRWNGASRTGSNTFFGLAGNKALDALVQAKTRAVDARWAGASELTVLRDYTETLYAAETWKSRRRVVARIEATYQGLVDTRFVVTNISHCGAQWLYDSLYCARGQAENLIKRHKSQLASDRTSCRSPLANQMRLTLHTAAYWLMRTLRDVIPLLQALASGEFSTIRLRLLRLQRGLRKPRPGSDWRSLLTPGCGAVPRAGWHAHPAPDMTGGAIAPAEPAGSTPHACEIGSDTPRSSQQAAKYCHWCFDIAILSPRSSPRIR